MIECYAGGGSNGFDFNTATQINQKNILNRKSKQQNRSITQSHLHKLKYMLHYIFLRLGLSE